MRAAVYQVQVPRSMKELQQYSPQSASTALLGDTPLLKHHHYHEWMDGEELEKMINAEIFELQNLLHAFRKKAPPLEKLNEALFDKDDETNGHVDFITAASNLRAMNYGIPPASR